MATTPTVRAVGTASSCTGARYSNPVIPATAEVGDRLILWITNQGGSTATPAGWTRDATSSIGASTFAQAFLCSKTCATGDPGASVEVDHSTGGGATNGHAGIIALASVRSNRAITASSTGGTDAAVSVQAAAAMTSIEGNTLAVTVWVGRNDDAGDIGNTWSVTPGTRQVSLAGDVVAGNGAVTAVMTDTSSAATARSATLSTTAAKAAVVSVLVAGAGGQQAVI